MASISKITIDGFKAFPNRFEDINLDGKNLLLYGENGSGKSSIYYALHCLLQSQVVDKSATYFDPNASESLVNKDTHKDDAFIEVQLTDSDVKYRVSKAGYEEIPDRGISPLKDLNGECVFINHKFLFHFFSFRNSQFINLFPVFIKDILPFTLTSNKAEFISQIYRDITEGIRKKGRSNQVDEEYLKRIGLFNKETKKIIDLINLPERNPNTATVIYNKFFRDTDDSELKITLEYEDYNHNIPKPNVSYWLRLGRRYQKILKAGAWIEHPISSRIEVLDPVICLKVEERLEDGNYQSIDKPQSYFNEAKLTAIALSIRFSLLDTITPINGRFMALDDMLISLDMSNRTKVVKYLLNIVDKYRIYLFTHDKAFYNYVRTAISEHSSNADWIFKTVSYNSKKKQPIILDEFSDYRSKAEYFYSLGDYETSAIYVRKQLEQSVGGLIPYELKINADGGFISLETLWKKLIRFYSDNGKPLDVKMQQTFSESKLLILNVAAHFQRLSNPIYKAELDMAFKLLNYINTLNRIDNKLIIEKDKLIVFRHPSHNYLCSFCLDSDLVLVEGEHLVTKFPKCKNIRWEYNGVPNWDFTINAPNKEHPLLKATPKFINFFKSCCEKLPLGITYDMLMHNCKIDDQTPLIEYFGGIDILKLDIKIDND